MSIESLPQDWGATRETLQRYAHALTALPRAGAPAHPRWAHVAMGIGPRGLLTTSTPMADGTELVSMLDLVENEIIVTAGDTRHVIDMSAGPSPKSVGDAVAAVATAHGSSIDVDEDRYSDDSEQEYDAAHAAAFLAVASSVVVAFDEINASVEGEITGPHLWPHGFDIATEWYSPKIVDYEGTPTNAQIAIGWYPAGEAYLYANPWPFDDGFTAAELPEGAVWNTEGWFGAKIAVSDLDRDSAHQTVVAFGTRVHETAHGALVG
ncbi:MAG: DUF5996 family protein [Actinomycetia bacterium]|nr:DUF5996 family protein [Actinomycetes bacterium]